MAIGSGGNFALAAARALLMRGADELTAKEIASAAMKIAADICPFTNHEIVVEEINAS